MVYYDGFDIIPPEDSLDPKQKEWDRLEQDRIYREFHLLDDISQNKYCPLQRQRDIRVDDKDI